MSYLWVLGDSWADPRSYLWAPALAWPQLLAAGLDMGIVNSGVAGSGYGYCGTPNFPAQAAQGWGAGADVVIVWGSLNDATQNRPVAEVRDGAVMTYGLIRRLCPDADLIVAGPQWGADEPPAALLAARDAVAAAARAVGARFIDTSRWFVGQPALMLDTYHVTAAGHAIVADRLAPEVAASVEVYATRRRRAYAARA